MKEEDISQIVKNYTTRFDKKLKKITSPLNDFFNIFNYVYFKIEEDGRFVTLSNYPEQLEYYYEEKFYLNNPYLVHPSLLKSGAVLTLTTQDDKYHETVVKSLERFNTHNTFLMLEKRNNQVEGHLFATRPGECDASFYLEKLPLLKKFNHYFAKEAAPILGKMRAEGFNLNHAKGKNFLERKKGLPLANKNDQEKAFLKAIFPLSPQEQLCFELFCQGHSAQSTAAVLNLSLRTVEHYFEKIKNKLGCRSKWDLLKIG